MTTAATQGKCKIDYIYLEMVLNQTTKYDVIAGLFKGILEKDGQKFILLQGLKNSTNVLSLKFYNILSIEELTGDYRNHTYLTSEKSDQDTAFEMVETAYNEIIEAGFCLPNDKKLIDVDKYSQVPKEYLEAEKIKSGSATSGSASGVGSFASPGVRYSGNGTTYVKNTTIKADPEPSLIKRTKSKKPTKAAIDIMFEKIQQIRAGNFVPELPETMGADAAGTTDADDDYSGYGAYC